MDRETLARVQPVLLEILEEIDRVCRENHIRYTLYRGTLLGAIRHGGFIPWDDDLDVAMLREDYEKFRKIAPQKLGEKFCFQDWHTDRLYALPFGKVRRRNTVYLEAKSRRLEENGLYVDVYPLDYAPEEPREQSRLARTLLHLYRLKLMKSGYTPWKEGTQTLWKKRLGYLAYQAGALFVSQEQLIEKYDALVASVPRSGRLYEQSALPHVFYFDSDWHAQTAEFSFCGKSFPGPQAADQVLTTLYGDYMVLPPEDRRENRHQIQELDFGDTSEAES